MRILILCTKFSLVESDGWLTNDLAAAFAYKGHDVTVVCVDWAGNSQAQFSTMYGNVTVINVPVNLARVRNWPGNAKKIYKWFWASKDAIPFVDSHLPKDAFDVFIGFSPAATTYWMQRHLLSKYRPHLKYMILWDFFPRYHAELGLVPQGVVYRCAKWLEARAISSFDVVGVMSPANVDFMRGEFPGFEGRTEVLPLWGPEVFPEPNDAFALRAKFALPPDRLLCIFGGQLIPGRGIELMLRLAAAVRTLLPDVLFVVAGKGPLESFLKNELAKPNFSNVRYIGQIPRDMYLQFLTICDIGIVFNSGTVTVPTFPSKTIDYLRAGLPILGAVEAATDYSDVIQGEIGAGYSCVTTDFERIKQNLVRLCSSRTIRQQMGRRGQAYFKLNMTAPTVAAQILSAKA